MKCKNDHLRDKWLHFQFSAMISATNNEVNCMPFSLSLIKKPTQY